jgi:hypothetical protein
VFGSRRRVAVAVVVLAAVFLLLGGPLGDGSGEPADLEPYPEPPDRLTNESAKRAAYQHETAHLDHRLGTAGEVHSYSLGSTVAGPERTVVDRNETGVYVRIRHPYGYSTSSADGDGLTNATYLVNESAIVVVERERGAYV